MLDASEKLRPQGDYAFSTKNSHRNVKKIRTVSDRKCSFAVVPGFVREQSFDGSVARKVFKNEAEFAAVGVDIAEVWTTQLDRSKESAEKSFFYRSKESFGEVVLLRSFAVGVLFCQTPTLSVEFHVPADRGTQAKRRSSS